MTMPSCIKMWADERAPLWADQVIEPWDDDKLSKLTPFIKSHFWSDRHSINVHSVVGTAHPDYIGLTWREFLHQGKRMRENQRLLLSNPIYYDETHVKQPSMLYISLNGKHWYVNGDGNHRTCLARFYFEHQNAEHANTKTMVHGVTVDDYRVDWDMYHLYLHIQDILIQDHISERVEPVRVHLERQDGPGWKNDKYQVRLRHITKAGQQDLTHREANALLARLEDRPTGLLAKLRWWR